MIQGVNVPIGLPVPTRSRLPDMLDIKRQNYYMNIAIAVRENANCKGRKVGAVIVRDNRIISTGYNGTPEGFTNCMDGGCVRCGKREEYRREGKRGYDECICVHAEQNALIPLPRFGNAIEDSVIFSTLRPCFDCTKLMLRPKSGPFTIFMTLENWMMLNCRGSMNYCSRSLSRVSITWILKTRERIGRMPFCRKNKALVCSHYFSKVF